MKLAWMSMKAENEVFLMRSQYFHDFTEQGFEAVMQIVFLVYQGHDSVYS